MTSFPLDVLHTSPEVEMRPFKMAAGSESSAIFLLLNRIQKLSLYYWYLCKTISSLLQVISCAPIVTDWSQLAENYVCLTWSGRVNNIQLNIEKARAWFKHKWLGPCFFQGSIFSFIVKFCINTWYYNVLALFVFWWYGPNDHFVILWEPVCKYSLQMLANYQLTG